MNVLIVEDEKNLASELELFLHREGYQCEVCHTGRQASEKLFINDYDFVLLDLGLPDSHGFDLLKEAIANKKNTAYLILTARGETADKIRGLNLGADDYLTKPFSLLELHSRMQAIARRKYGLHEPVIAFHGFLLDPLQRRITFAKAPFELTRKEFDVLHYLLLHRNRVLTRFQLAEHIWGNHPDDDGESNYIDVHIKNLRKKLGTYAPTPWLETLRGIGYRINC